MERITPKYVSGCSRFVSNQLSPNSFWYDVHAILCVALHLAIMD